jgi:hypothetical protein
MMINQGASAVGTAHHGSRTSNTEAATQGSLPAEQPQTRRSRIGNSNCLEAAASLTGRAHSAHSRGTRKAWGGTTPSAQQQPPSTHRGEHAQRELGLASLGAELLSHTTTYLTHHEALSLGHANHQIATMVSQYVDAARLCLGAQQITNLQDFLHALDGRGEGVSGPISISRLPRGLQYEPLIALGSRITSLPIGHQDTAADAWRSYPFQGRTTPLLDEMRSAAECGGTGMWGREWILVMAGDAKTAVLHGHDAQETAREFGITNRDFIEILNLTSSRVNGANSPEPSNVATTQTEEANHVNEIGDTTNEEAHVER